MRVVSYVSETEKQKKTKRSKKEEKYMFPKGDLSLSGLSDWWEKLLVNPLVKM